MTQPAELCPRRPFAHLSGCLRELDHDGRCVFAKIRGGSARGRGAVVVNFYEQTARGASFRSVGHADYQRRPSRQDAAALWAASAELREAMAETPEAET